MAAADKLKELLNLSDEQFEEKLKQSLLLIDENTLDFFMRKYHKEIDELLEQVDIDEIMDKAEAISIVGKSKNVRLIRFTNKIHPTRKKN